MSLKNHPARARCVAAALCLSTLTLHTAAFAQAASAPDASAHAGPGRDAAAGGRAHGHQGDDRQPLRPWRRFGSRATWWRAAR